MTVACHCIYATAQNTASVRSGHEMGGYLKRECNPCRMARITAEREKDRAIPRPALTPEQINSLASYVFNNALSYAPMESDFVEAVQEWVNGATT
jgi:hypothetical protein